MEFGIKTENKKTFCKTCGKELKIEVPNNIYNFCPFCSAPLNLVSYNFVKEREKNQKLKTILELLKDVNNPSVSMEIEKYLNKISKE